MNTDEDLNSDDGDDDGNDDNELRQIERLTQGKFLFLPVEKKK